MVSIANALFLSLVILQQVMCMTLHWKWFGSLTWGDWFQVSSKERTDYYHKKEFGKKKNLVHSQSSWKLSIINEIASAENTAMGKEQPESGVRQAAAAISINQCKQSGLL